MHVHVFANTKGTVQLDPFYQQPFDASSGVLFVLQQGQNFIIAFLSRGTNNTTCTVIVMANRITCTNAMMRPNINKSFENLNLQNIVHLARVNRLV
jgi:hypothetical protein